MFLYLYVMESEKLKSVKMTEPVHTKLKVFIAQNRIKNMASFIDAAVIDKMKSFAEKKKIAEKEFDKAK